MKKTLEYLQQKKRSNRKIIALTSYDYPTTVILEEAAIDMIILGDSVGTNVLGYNNETEVTLEDMIHHTKAVCRGKKDVFVVVDLPYKTHETPRDAVENAKKLIDVGADAVKFESVQRDVLVELKNHHFNVMCHIGLNPQYDQERMKQGRVAKGKSASEAIELLQGAVMLEKAGADLIILEKIPEKVSKIITQNVTIPTIGIGAGKYCDGQVLIIYDLLGMNKKIFRHAPSYINLREIIVNTIHRYQIEIAEGAFPNESHINIIKDDELSEVERWCLQNNYML